ncbi:MAG: uroporphyrinogen-III C-methyltransferase [Chloroflexota bacterium]
MTIGNVYLVGAGPGDPDLITRKGLRLIQQADIIIYDRLIPHELLGEARAGAELINAGKAPTKHRLNQDEINATIVRKALQGKQVVRLKGGDPLVFGRGSEEALVCYEQGIPFEIIPGISSSYAAPAYAGIPLTHREISRSFTVITGHTPDDINYEALANVGGTLVVLMGVKSLPVLVQRLIAAGLDPDTPAASIEWGATQQQSVLEARIADLPQHAIEANLQAPATTVIGEVVRLRAQGVQWFDLLPDYLLQERAV